ncbi:1-phosphofructokinase family hexose kinase [Rhodocaloribacter sp.]
MSAPGHDSAPAPAIIETAIIETLTLNPAVDKNTRLDHVAAERKLRCGPPRFEPGGGGVNVSRAIRKLGGASSAFFLSGGPMGRRLEELLAEEGIDRHPFAIEGWTRENLNVTEETTGRQFRFVLPGPEVRAEAWRRCLDAVAALTPTPAFLVASGSLPPGVPADAYARIAEVVRPRGTRVIVDTSGPALQATLRAPVFLIKPNLNELAALAGKPLEDETSVEREAGKLIAEGRCEAVVVSLGGGGALLATKAGLLRFHAPAVPIRSKVGAGDSMVAGLTLALARGRPLPEAVRFGVAAGTAAVMTPGTELCRRADVERLYPRVTATPLSSHGNAPIPRTTA